MRNDDGRRDVTPSRTGAGPGSSAGKGLPVRVGHWTGRGTGVTVILAPPGTVASGEVRGGAPATREFALLDPTCLVTRVDAVVLCGGSAFGLSAADGVMSVLREAGVGYETPAGRVPIVVAMSIYDGSVAGHWPTAAAGRSAALAARSGGRPLTGRVGAGTGASTGKWLHQVPRAGGFGFVQERVGACRVAAFAVVNSWGDVVPPGRPDLDRDENAWRAHEGTGTDRLCHTTLGVIVIDAKLTKGECLLVSQSGHDGFAIALRPAHSQFDGDAVVTLATGSEPAEVGVDMLRAVAVEVMAKAIRAAARADPDR